MIKKLYTLILGLILFPSVVYANKEAITFVDNLTEKIITNVLEKEGSKDNKLPTFRRDFIGALDTKNIGQFVLGVYWKKATPEEREKFLTAFIEFATLTWADRFDTYNGQKIVFTGARNADKNQFYVDSIIQNNPPVEVVWRVKQKKDGYKIIDIIIAGVSMVMSYRNEYSSFLQAHNGSVNELTQELQEKSKNFTWSNHKKK